MDEETPTAMPPAAADFADIMRRYHDFEARVTDLLPLNKAALLKALGEQGIAKVMVRFDGAGDSGQIEEVTAFGEDGAERPITEAAVELQKISYGDDAPEAMVEPLGEAIDSLAYALLQSSHCGWENNEGAYGDFTFDVAAGLITLEYNERYETSELFTHEF
ncbi:DUF6878 family protein [Sphingopyxis sp. NJF-3]